MSIRSDAYSLCKNVFRAPLTGQLRQIIVSLERTSTNPAESASQNRSLLGYLALDVRAQLLSFLLVDKASYEPQQSPFLQFIPHLLDSEREVLTRAHAQILRLNRQCIAPLLSQLPHYDSVVDPYAHFDSVPLPVEPGEDFLPSDTVTAMARSFHSHPAFPIALDSKPLPPTAVAELSRGVSQFIAEIYRVGAYYAPRDIKDIIIKNTEGSPPRIIFRHLAALACIRQSLAMLDQLVFQVLLSDKLRLPILNEDNIIHFGDRVTTYVSVGTRLTFQPDEWTPRGSNGHLLLLKWSHRYEPIDELSSVEDLHINYSQDTGMKGQIELRSVDENLNPFDQLLKLV